MILSLVKMLLVSVVLLTICDIVNSFILKFGKFQTLQELQYELSYCVSPFKVLMEKPKDFKGRTYRNFCTIPTPLVEEIIKFISLQFGIGQLVIFQIVFNGSEYYQYLKQFGATAEMKKLRKHVIFMHITCSILHVLNMSWAAFLVHASWNYITFYDGGENIKNSIIRWIRKP